MRERAADLRTLNTRVGVQATALERKNRQLEHILAITGAARLDQPLPLLLHRLAHATCDALGFHIAVVYLAEPDGHVFRAQATYGLDPHGWTDVLRRPIARRVAERLMHPRYRLGANSYYIRHDDAIWRDPAVQESISAIAQGPSLPADSAWHPHDCLLVPLVTEASGLIGFITPDGPIDGCIPTPETAHVLEIFANSAALLIQNAWLYRRSEQQARRLATLTEIATVLSSTLDVEDLAARVYKQVSRVLDVGSFSFAVRDPQGLGHGRGLVRILVVDEGVRYPNGPVPGPAGSEGRRGPRIYTAAELAAETDSRYGNGLPSVALVSAPLYAGEVFLGEIEVGSYRPDAYSEEDAWLIQAIADQAGIALENARLYESEVARAIELEEISRLRRDFIATVSHELRTPLTAIIGFTETLLGYWTRLPESRRLEMLHKSQAAAARLNRLVQDLLLVSRIDAQDVTLHPRTVALAPLVDQAASEVRGKYGEQGVEIAVPVDVHVYADPHRVEQVLINLLDNAAKYSPEGAPIGVTAETGDGMAVVRVRDRGHGMDPELTHRLFTRFGKMDTTVRAGHVGTGLGLYISKRLVEAMRGRIWVDTSGAEGSTFAFSIPLAPARQPSRPRARPRRTDDTSGRP